MRYVCSICGYIYDEAKEKTPFSQLPESWKCPLCKAAKSLFAPEEKKETEPAFQVPPETPEVSEDLKKLSAGEFAALCSNLARGCEKQYKEEEAALFHQLADYFAAAAPPVPDGDLEKLSRLLKEDLTSGYRAVNAAADGDGDRPTKRICVWGEKVTNMLSSLIEQYRQEGESFLAGTNIWVCSVCGFIYVGDEPPRLCPVCKVPDWKFEKAEGRAEG